MENNIQIESHEEEILNPGQFPASNTPEEDDLQTDLQADPENDDLLGGSAEPEPLEDEDALDDEADDDDLDLGDADGSGGELESDEDLED